MKLNVYKASGEKSSKQVELSDAVVAIEPHDHAIWMDVRVIQANGRQGTHQTKARSQVRGGGRKPFRQKGTGRARQGTIRAPQYVGGGRVFGAHPRAYRMKINRKLKKLARRSALTYKAKEGKIIVLENFNMDKPSTKEIEKLINAFELKGKRVLLCTSEASKNIVKSASNLVNVNVCLEDSFSTYDILRADTLLMQEGVVEKVNERLAK